MKIVYWSALLLDHLRACPICTRAKVTRSASRCATRQQLIAQTLKERHG